MFAFFSSVCTSLVLPHPFPLPPFLLWCFVFASSVQNKCGIFRNNEAILNVAARTPQVSHAALVQQAFVRCPYLHLMRGSRVKWTIYFCHVVEMAVSRQLMGLSSPFVQIIKPTDVT